uniref:Uncharacterized protein n=1 Tax=Nelumbo nucifera TaxID=4432 RepID=A0A822XU48_NELNU|nr:TPA_asm: hypothetical protein HUJ06_023808 [Nelumbo nucifera]
MAQIKFILTCIFVSVLIFSSQDVVSVEGRHLESGKRRECKKCSSHGNGRTISGATIGGGEHSSVFLHERTIAEYVDSFRPTAPGHSPGAGHSLNN